MANVKVLRLQTGEDVIADLIEGSKRHTLKKAFVIIPMQGKPGQPVQLMMTPYMPYSEDDDIVIDASKVVTIVRPKKDILTSYRTNTSTIFTPDKELITETNIPTNKPKWFMVKVNFIRNGIETISVDVPVGRTVMEAAKEADIEEIPADCGGSCACATCHIIVDDVWCDKIKIEENSMEQELLEYEPGYIKGKSRCGCQIYLTENLDGLKVKLRDNELL